MFNWTCSGAFENALDVDLAPGELKHIADIPFGVYNFYANLSSLVDLDLHIYDMWRANAANHYCLVGHQCDHPKPGTWEFNGMQIYFTGDDVHTPVSEHIFIPQTTQKLSLYVNGYQKGVGHLNCGWEYINPCTACLTSYGTYNSVNLQIICFVYFYSCLCLLRFYRTIHIAFVLTVQ